MIAFFLLFYLTLLFSPSNCYVYVEEEFYYVNLGTPCQTMQQDTLDFTKLRKISYVYDHAGCGDWARDDGVPYESYNITCTNSTFMRFEQFNGRGCSPSDFDHSATTQKSKNLPRCNWDVPDTMKSCANDSVVPSTFPLTAAGNYGYSKILYADSTCTGESIGISYEIDDYEYTTTFCDHVWTWPYFGNYRRITCVNNEPVWNLYLDNLCSVRNESVAENIPANTMCENAGSGLARWGKYDTCNFLGSPPVEDTWCFLVAWGWLPSSTIKSIRGFRDSVMVKSKLGRVLVKLYYKIGSLILKVMKL